MKIQFYTELCCDFCNEIVHNHFDCPICNTKESETDMYHSIFEHDIDFGFICLNCRSEFKFIEIVDIGLNEFDIKLIKKGEK